MSWRLAEQVQRVGAVVDEVQALPLGGKGRYQREVPLPLGNPGTAVLSNWDVATCFRTNGTICTALPSPPLTVMMSTLGATARPSGAFSDPAAEHGEAGTKHRMLQDEWRGDSGDAIVLGGGDIQR
jgi:hypothetical protein